MADDAFRAKFIHVRDLLTQAARGIGEGNKALVNAAATNYGTLAVKAAEVTVDFVLSSNAPSQDGKDVGVGANTLFGFVPGMGLIPDALSTLASDLAAPAKAALGAVSVLQQQEVSRAKIVLTIVPIAPPALPPAATGDKGTDPSGSTSHGPTVVSGNGGTTSQGDDSARQQLAGEITRVYAVIKDLKISDADRKVLFAKVGDIENLLKAGNVGDAAAALKALIAQNPNLAKT